MEPNAQTPKGPWLNRFLIRLFTLATGLLVFWVLGFIVNDIGSIKGPDYQEIERQYVDGELLERSRTLATEITDLEREIKDKRDELQILSASSANVQETITQLISLQRLSLEKGAALPGTDETVSLSTSLEHFLKTQDEYQEQTRELARLVGEKRALESEKIALERQIDQQRKPAHEEFRRLNERNRLRVAAIKLAVLVPLLAVSVFLVLRKRSSIYFPVLAALAGATLVKVALVMHEYFPARYFKYILVLGLLAAVVKVLLYFIRTVAFPKAEWLTKQYREAYERFLCPVCEYPIRIGPRRFLYWTRRTVNRLVQARGSSKEEIYTCPSCGTQLFEECTSCRKVRHSLLPYCRHCHAVKPLTEEP